MQQNGHSRAGHLLHIVLVAAPSLSAGLGCGAPPPIVPEALDPAAYAALRADVQALTAPHCGSCHDKTLPSSKPEALAIFDYTVEDWPMMLEEEQMPTFQRRLGGSLDEAGDAKVARLFSAVLSRKDESP
jgi:mono/diheme cytochrome c family protein